MRSFGFKALKSDRGAQWLKERRNKRMKKKITYVIGDDWEGVYFDGKLMAEGHHVTLREFAELLGLEFETIEVGSGWLEELGNLPKDLSDVVEA